MKIDLTGRKPCLIQDNEEGCYIFDHLGYAMEVEQMEYLANRLLETAKGIEAREIEEYNKKVDDRLYEAYNIHCEKSPKQKKSACVYMLECGGRYKIGYSLDVERRVAELDKRPFPVKIMAMSKSTTEAYDIEQYIHSRLEHLRICGEWYEISPEGAEKVKKYIERIS